MPDGMPERMPEGTDAPVVLLHAFPLSSLMWAAQREALAGLGHRVLAPDLRGFGTAPLGAVEPSLDAVVDDVVALLDRHGIDRVTLGGLSMGAYVAMAFLHRHPQRVRALMLVSTKARADTDAEKATRATLAAHVGTDEARTRLLTALLPDLVGASTRRQRPAVVEAVRSMMLAAPAASVAWALRAIAGRRDSVDTLRGARVPALVAVGAEDVLSPPDDAAAMTRVIPSARLAVVPRAGHLLALERPAALTSLMAGFLRGLGGHD
jgi:pimeloyl-ACP methyl ester carboxylesterase